MSRLGRVSTLIALLLALASPAAGQAPLDSKVTPSAVDLQQKELNAALESALAAATRGPGDVRLGTQGKVTLTDRYQFVPLPHAKRLMRAFGNGTDDAFIGLILSTKDTDGFIVTVNFEKAGYVKDDDAKNWKADDLLEQLKEGTKAANEDRRARGFPELEVAGWVEPPVYDATTHRLVWSALARTKGETSGGSVNYNTYALGREGFYKLNLVTGRDTIEADKVHARTLLAALSYDPGKRYGEFNPSSDHVAEYGLAALVAGVAAKKLGLLAVIGVTLAKFGKAITLAVVAGSAILAKRFGRRSKS